VDQAVALEVDGEKHQAGDEWAQAARLIDE